MVFGLLACDVWPIASSANEPASLFLLVCKLLWWDEILREPGVLSEHRQKLGSLLLGQQAECDRCNQMMTALGPCVDGLGWTQQKNSKNQSE
jgi:hypothetical protein